MGETPWDRVGSWMGCGTLGTRLSPRLAAELPGVGVGHGGPVTPATQSQWLNHVGYFSELVLAKGELLSWGWGRVGQSLVPPALPP